MTFHELNLDADLQRGIDDAGFATCTEVQEKTFEHTLKKRDVTVQSQTGTGKTAAFLITIYQLLRSDPEFQGSAALVVAPTRELAVQIEADAKMLGKHLDFRMVCIYGGVGYKPQEDALREGVDLVVATPGRLLDLNQSKKFDFRMFKIAVIDEADRLFDMGFYPDIRKIFRKLPPKDERITMLYSATLGTRVLNISWEYMNNPAEIQVTPEQMTVEAVEQQVFHVSKNEKFSLLLGLLRQEAPESCLIFANTKSMCEELSYRLRENGYKAEYIIGDLPQSKRLRIIDDLKNGKVSMLVATDVAARGLHVEDLDLVVNYDLPEDPESYVHRIGRTARAGKKGRAISLACERFVYSLEPIQEFIDMKIPAVHPGDADFAEDASRGKSLGQVRRGHGGSSTSRSGRKKRSSETRSSTGRPGGGGRSSDAREKTRHSEREGAGAGGNKSGSGTSGGGHRRDDHGHGSKRSSGNRHGGGRSRSDRPARAASAGGSGKPAAKAAAPGGDQAERPKKDSSREARLQYYRDKYGEDFAFADGGTPEASKAAASPKQRKEPAPPSRTEESGSSGSSGKSRKGILGRLRRALKG